MICWSHYPSAVVAFGALGMVAMWRLLIAQSFRSALLAGALAGYSAAGFAMQLYVPWMVSLAYFYGVILLGIMFRDRMAYRLAWRPFLAGMALAVAIAAGILIPFVVSAAPELRALAESASPDSGASAGRTAP